MGPQVSMLSLCMPDPQREAPNFKLEHGQAGSGRRRVKLRAVTSGVTWVIIGWNVFFLIPRRTFELQADGNHSDFAKLLDLNPSLQPFRTSCLDLKGPR